MPGGSPGPAPWVGGLSRCMLGNGRLCPAERLNEELLQRLAAGRGSPAKPFRVQRAPDTAVPLDHDSQPGQVQAWLEAKGFEPL